MPRRHAISGLTVTVSLVVLLVGAPGLGAVADTLPASIADREFWALSERLSEPNGYFISDNLVSNERTLSTVASALAVRVERGGVYLGVGPEQNYTYIAAMRPKIAFITDIRRGNLHLHLMYKALFELSETRADFVSRLFTKPRPDRLTTRASAADLMNAYWNIPTSSDETYRRNLDALYHVLATKHGWKLSPEDREGVAYVYHAFYWYGPRITYGSSQSSAAYANGVTYADLMMSISAIGQHERSYLADEDSFGVVKDLHRRNLIVPVVGDFAGPKALRAVGQYIRDHGASVTAFYVSNVEQYLRRNDVWPAFCANVATMPLTEESVFIRPGGMAGALSALTFTPGIGANNLSGADVQRLAQLVNGASAPSLPFSPIAAEVANCGVR